MQVSSEPWQQTSFHRGYKIDQNLHLRIQSQTKSVHLNIQHYSSNQLQPFVFDWLVASSISLLTPYIYL